GAVPRDEAPGADERGEAQERQGDTAEGRLEVPAAAGELQRPPDRVAGPQPAVWRRRRVPRPEVAGARGGAGRGERPRPGGRWRPRRGGGDGTETPAVPQHPLHQRRPPRGDRRGRRAGPPPLQPPPPGPTGTARARGSAVHAT